MIAVLAVVSLLIINNYLYNEVFDLLDEEGTLLENRILAVRTALDGSMTPLNMLNSHSETVLAMIGTGDVDQMSGGELTLDEDRGYIRLEPEQGNWSVSAIPSERIYSDTAVAELLTIRLLADLYEDVIENRPNTAWVYYLSDSGFMFIVPPYRPFSLDELNKVFEYSIWTEAIPEQNPDHTLIVTDPYEDLGGKGMMITLSLPLLSGGKFLGVTAIDVLTSELDDALNLGRSLGISSIIDEKRSLVTSLDESPVGESYGFSGDMDSQYGIFGQHGNNYVMERSLIEGELTFAHRVPRSIVYRDAIRHGLPLIFAIIGLNILIFMFIRLRRTYLEAAEDRDFSRRLLSIVGHDLQSPLSVTRQATEILIMNRDWDAAELIRKSNQSALALLKDLSLWGKSRFGEVRMTSAACPVSVVFDRVREAVAPQAEIKDITLEVETSVPTVNADADVLAVVLRNLVANAIKYSRPGQMVRLRSLPGIAGSAVFNVEDDGDGMDRSQVHKVMNRRMLASRPGTRGEKGSGIGLSLVTGLCDQAGWPLSLESTPDKGTTFTISVPVE